MNFLHVSLVFLGHLLGWYCDNISGIETNTHFFCKPPFSNKWTVIAKYQYTDTVHNHNNETNPEQFFSNNKYLKLTFFNYFICNWATLLLQTSFPMVSSIFLRWCQSDGQCQPASYKTIRFLYGFFFLSQPVGLILWQYSS